MKPREIKRIIPEGATVLGDFELEHCRMSHEPSAKEPETDTKKLNEGASSVD